LQSRIDQLSKILEQRLEIEKTLSQQVHRRELDLHQTARRTEVLEATKVDLAVKLNELHLGQDSLEQLTIKSRSLKGQVLVSLNMLRLQIEKLSEQVATKSDELIY
jgi:hypothetical protein